MIKKILTLVLGLLGAGCLAAAGFLAFQQFERYGQARAVYPPGTVVADIPIDGLDLNGAVARLSQAYLNVPVEIHYRGTVLQAMPTSLGFSLDFSAMLAPAEVARTGTPFWQGYWDFLWNRPIQAPAAIPLTATLAEEPLRAYLQNEVAARLDAAPIPGGAPALGRIEYAPGTPGTILDTEQAVLLLSAALHSRDARRVELSASPVLPARPGLDNLQKMMEQILLLSGYSGTAEIYLRDLQNGQDFRLALDQGQQIPAGIAFTAASTMKIPIMIAVFRRQPDPLPEDIHAMLVAMIEFSDNDMSDRLIKTFGETSGPLRLTQDIQVLGLKNTFLAGYFAPGAPLLERFQTPANQRVDISTAPDVYNQTTPAEMGRLLEAIYTCAEKDSGLLEETFPGQITQSKCKQMVELLAGNKNGALLEAGVPEGTRVAHKHGWTSESDNLIHAISDTGILYTPGGNYVMAVYLHTREQLLWDPINGMVAWLSQAAYDYFNLP